MAAFEDYPRTRYGIDAIALWSRLVPLLRQNEYLDFVNQEKRVFDFLLNTCVVIAVLGLETSYIALYKGVYLLWIVPVALLLGFSITWVLYQAMIFAARQWGTTVRAAFDIYRHDLYKHLGLRPSYSFKTEYERWRAISQFLLYRREHPEDFGEFVPQVHLVDYKKG